MCLMTTFFLLKYMIINENKTLKKNTFSVVVLAQLL